MEPEAQTLRAHKTLRNSWQTVDLWLFGRHLAGLHDSGGGLVAACCSLSNHSILLGLIGSAMQIFMIGLKGYR